MSAPMRGLRAGAATGAGSLPHSDPESASALSLSVHADLPALPELPNLSDAEGMVERWLAGADSLRPGPHTGFLEFLTAARDATPRAVKAQVAGPLTLARAMLEEGTDPAVALEAGADLATRAAATVVDAIQKALPHTEPVLFLDEPALVEWRSGEPAWDRELAVDVLSGTLSGVDAITGVHVCGDGERRMAIEAGPEIVGFPLVDSVLDDGIALSRFLDGGGWIAWGVIPTDRPVGAKPDHWWNELVTLWCDLTRAGCDPVALRTQSIITPACGLAGHSEEQAAAIYEQCVEIGERVREQAVATRLSVGA